MKNWRKFLRDQAQEMGAKVIDTTNLSLGEVVKEFGEVVNL